jgi:hypothetical protein
VATDYDDDGRTAIAEILRAILDSATPLLPALPPGIMSDGRGCL